MPGLEVAITFVVAPLVIAFVYGVWVKPREEQLRGYLARRRSDRRRARIVKSFVGAFNGLAGLEDSAALWLLQVSLFALLAAGQFLTGVGVLAAAGAIPEHGLRSWMGDEFGIWVGVANIAFSGLSVFIVCRLVFVNKEVRFMTRLLAHHLQRFTMRIQGLASKAEIAELAMAEARVKDEATLKEFVLTARRIAERHDAGALVDPFDLWKSA